MTLYAASFGYRDCDPIATVVATTADKAEELIDQGMSEEAIHSREQCELGHDCDCGRDCTCGDCQWCCAPLVWYGVHEYTELPWRGTIQDIEEDGYAWL